jgi:hypothetical protein
MAAVAWTAIGLLGTALAVLVGAYFRLGSRIESQGRELRVAIESQGRELRVAIESQTARIDALNARMDAHLERHAS